MICFFDSTSFYSSSWKEAFFIFFREPSWQSSISTKPLICHFLYTLPFLTHTCLSQEDKFSIHVVDAALCVALRSFDVALKSFVPLLFFTPLPNVESGSGSGSLTRKASFCQKVFWTQYTSPIHDLYTPFLSKLQIPLTISSLFGGENNRWMKKVGWRGLCEGYPTWSVLTIHADLFLNWVWPSSEGLLITYRR